MISFTSCSKNEKAEFVSLFVVSIGSRFRWKPSENHKRAVIPAHLRGGTPLHLLVLIKSVLLPLQIFMKLRILVSVTWFNYRIPSKIYLNYRFTAQTIVKYRIPYYRSPINKDTLFLESFIGRSFLDFASFSVFRESLCPRNRSCQAIRESLYQRNLLKPLVL